MKDEFVIERHGKKYALFAGLLDEAHSLGLRGIDTDLLQIPDDSNGHVAIVKAEVDMGEERKFQGIGDASPENVGRSIAPHLIRMAETRAKARALRDAINASVAVADDADMDAPAQGSEPVRSQPRSPEKRVEGGANPEQVKMIGVLVHELWPGKENVALQNILKEKPSVEALTPQEANDLIEWLHSKAVEDDPDQQGEGAA